jgi:hypothetical protein
VPSNGILNRGQILRKQMQQKEQKNSTQNSNYHTSSSQPSTHLNLNSLKTEEVTNSLTRIIDAKKGSHLVINTDNNAYQGQGIDAKKHFQRKKQTEPNLDYSDSQAAAKE